VDIPENVELDFGLIERQSDTLYRGPTDVAVVVQLFLKMLFGFMDF